MNNIIGILASIIFVGLILFIATLAEKKDILSGEGSRKFIHIILGNWWLLAMFFYDNAIWAAIVPFLFVIINYISYKKGLISAMERDGSIEDLGTVYYAISLFILSLWTFGIERPYIGAIGILVMGYGDGFAAIIGSKHGHHKFTILRKSKSIEGSFCVFIITFIISMFIMPIIGHPVSILNSIILSIIATLIEALTPFGMDNLSLPLTISYVYYTMIS
ncbi:MAG: hypothetical protein N4A40_16570 [Tissierellales bacterium]|jgi:phytol kinase|nr:hypothetical protein [Tissierellales bacterium]